MYGLNDMVLIDCASLTRIQTLGPVKVHGFVSVRCLSNVWGTKVVPKMFEYVWTCKVLIGNIIKCQVMAFWIETCFNPKGQTFLPLKMVAEGIYELNYAFLCSLLTVTPLDTTRSFFPP